MWTAQNNHWRFHEISPWTTSDTSGNWTRKHLWHFWRCISPMMWSHTKITRLINCHLHKSMLLVKTSAILLGLLRIYSSVMKCSQSTQHFNSTDIYYTVSQKNFPPLNSLQLRQILTDFQIFLHCWKAYEICYKNRMTLPTSPKACCHTTLRN